MLKYSPMTFSKLLNITAKESFYLTGMIFFRWYEPVIIGRDGGTSLSYRQMVVTGQEVFTVDTPHKSVLSLLQIQSISAVLLVRCCFNPLNKEYFIIIIVR